MSHTVIVSDHAYQRLVISAQRRGLQSVEQLLEEWQLDDDIQTRQAAVERIDALRNHLFEKYSEMPDSTSLLREDRER